MELGETYFWTSSVHKWKHLLKPDKYKQVIIDSLRYLVEKNKIRVYSFVIMPNHIHLLWEMLEMNGKEMPHASFQKFTSHMLEADLKVNHPEVLKYFVVNEKERAVRIWQRDALAIKILSKEMAEQKLDYIHLNPLQSHWNLCTVPEAYTYSSASFYEGNKSIDWSKFICDYRARF